MGRRQGKVNTAKQSKKSQKNEEKKRGRKRKHEEISSPAPSTSEVKKRGRPVGSKAKIPSTTAPALPPRPQRVSLKPETESVPPVQPGPSSSAMESQNVAKRRGRRSMKGLEDMLDLIPNRPQQLGRRPSKKLTEKEIQECCEREVLERLKRNHWEDALAMHANDPEQEESESKPDAEVVCPHPGPRKGRVKAKVRPTQATVPNEQFKEMEFIIKGTIRESLSSNSSRASSLADSLPDVKADLGEDPIASDKKKKKGTLHILCPNLRKILELQRKWMQEKLLQARAPGFQEKLAQETAERFANTDLKNEMRNQLYVEHLSWITHLVDVQTRTNEDKKPDVFAWVPEFSRRFHFPSFEELSNPINHRYRNMLYDAAIKTTAKLNDLLLKMIRSLAVFKKMKTLVESVSHDKQQIYKEYEDIHDRIASYCSELDETSFLGLKPVRVALELPYFKSVDDTMAAPTLCEPGTPGLEEYFRCYFKRDKQKWTTKDIDHLKLCITDCLRTRRGYKIEDRYLNLLYDCQRVYQQQLEEEGRFEGDTSSGTPVQRQIGADRQSELITNSKYGMIFPVAQVYPNGMIIRTGVTPQTLCEWRKRAESELQKKSFEDLLKLEEGKIDWDIVSNQMVIKSRKNRSAEDCELAFKHEVDPEVNSKRWTKEEADRLVKIYQEQKEKNELDWDAIAKYVNGPKAEEEGSPGRTAYQCFFRVRNKVDPPKKVEWNDELDRELVAKLKEHPGNWRTVAASLSDPSATKRQCIERYKKTVNPVLRSGPFTRVEDCLLILTIEKLKPFLAREGHFGSLLPYLPWRCETTWRDRANNLFSDWIVPWTLEEDKMLLELAVTMNRNWQQISEQFSSFKNRKGCLTRFKILKARLEDERFDNSLEAYHEAYAMTRYNVFQYRHLKDVLTVLLRVQKNPLPPEHIASFPGLLRDEKPSEVRLQHMLLAYDKQILNQTIDSLSRYVKTRDDYWKEWNMKHGKRKRTFDRRTFHPENPQSVASALHIRGIKLHNKEEIPDLTDFEQEIYKFYGRFCRTKALKEKADRPYIPSAKQLGDWETVSRLIALVPVEEEKKSKKKSGKKKDSDSDSESEPEPSGIESWNLSFAVRKRGGKSKVKQWKSTSKGGIKKGPGSIAKKLKDKAIKKGRKAKANALNTNEDGYLLIPAESMVKQAKNKKQAKERKKNDDNDEEDPDYSVAGPSSSFKKKGPKSVLMKNSSCHRRSSRVIKLNPKYQDKMDESDDED